MKILLLALTAGTLFVSTSLAGNWFGSGPWANGAYYPGQFDGVYSASMFEGSPGVVSGVLGFGLDNGSPSTNDITTDILTSIVAAENYFVVYVDGLSYVGSTIANINNNSSQVNGGLAAGRAAPTFSVIATTNFPGTTNQTVTITQLTVENTCGGGFAATVTGNKSVISFQGVNTGTLATSRNGVPTATNTFSLDGLKVGN
jgi:hypothetical protein